MKIRILKKLMDKNWGRARGQISHLCSKPKFLLIVSKVDLSVNNKNLPKAHGRY